MNTFRILLLSFIVLQLFSCSNNPYLHTFQTADSLSYSNPDSALNLLAKLKDNIATESKETQMYFHLLTIKAKDKVYMPHTSDSLMMQILHYYEDKGDKKHLPEAYYYAGRVYRDLGDAPQALDYFQKAAETLEGVTDYLLISKIYSQMGRLFYYQNVHEEAMRAFKKAYKYNILIKDYKGATLNLRDIGDAFMALNHADSALYYYKAACDKAKEQKDQQYIDATQDALLSYYIQLEKYESAQRVLGNTRKKNTKRAYILLAHLHNETGHLDSAYYFYKQILESNNIYTQQAVHWGLAQIAQKRSDSKMAIEHIKQYCKWTDSIQKITNTENIRKMHFLYNYQLREKKNDMLETENAKQKLWTISALLMLAVLSIFFTIYYFKAKQKRTRLQSSLRELEHLEKMQKEQINSMNHKIETERKEHELAIVNFKQSKIYNKFHTAQNITDLEDADWSELQRIINSTYKEFTHHLYSLYPISNIELRICLLIKADISISNIALLTGRTKSTITSARKKLYEKVHGVKGGPELWDNLILSL